jgi:hypothetical protein
MNVYGLIITADDVASAVVDHLRTWTSAYIGEISAQSGRPRCGEGALPPFRSIDVASSFSKFPEDQVPACVVVCPGLSDTPIRGGDGAYLAEWSVGLGVVVSARDRDSTDELVRRYSAAVRAAMLQHPSLNGFAQGCRWIDEDYDELGYDDSRSIAAGIVSLGVEVPEVLNVYGGPKEPPDNACIDPGNYGIVLDTPLQTKEAAQ